MWQRLYYHIVWTTRLRDPIIDAGGAMLLCRFFRPVAARYRVRVLEVGMVRTHVHLLFSAHPQTDFPKLIGHWKGGSATAWNTDYALAAGWELRWAKGYGLSTVGRRQIEQVREYLKVQPRHHPGEGIDGWDGDRSSHEFLR